MRADRAVLGNLSYGLNIEDVIRFEVFYDQALVTQRLAGYSSTYFSGAGLGARLERALGQHAHPRARSAIRSWRTA